MKFYLEIETSIIRNIIAEVRTQANSAAPTSGYLRDITYLNVFICFMVMLMSEYSYQIIMTFTKLLQSNNFLRRMSTFNHYHIFVIFQHDLQIT